MQIRQNNDIHIHININSPFMLGLMIGTCIASYYDPAFEFTTSRTSNLILLFLAMKAAQRMMNPTMQNGIFHHAHRAAEFIQGISFGMLCLHPMIGSFYHRIENAFPSQQDNGYKPKSFR